jgi:hypothetical protein
VWPSPRLPHQPLPLLPPPQLLQRLLLTTTTMTMTTTTTTMQSPHPRASPTETTGTAHPALLSPPLLPLSLWALSLRLLLPRVHLPRQVLPRLSPLLLLLLPPSERPSGALWLPSWALLVFSSCRSLDAWMGNSRHDFSPSVRESVLALIIPLWRVSSTKGNLAFLYTNKQCPQRKISKWPVLCEDLCTWGEGRGREGAAWMLPSKCIRLAVHHGAQLSRRQHHAACMRIHVWGRVAAKIHAHSGSG